VLPDFLSLSLVTERRTWVIRRRRRWRRRR